MDDSQSPLRQHLVAFGAMAGIGVPIIAAGVYAGFVVAKAITGVDWTETELETTLQAVTYLTLTVGGGLITTFPAIYLWLRALRGRIDPDVVYHWLTAGPQPPVLSNITKRMFHAVYDQSGRPV